MHIVTRFVTHLWISSTMHRMALSALCFREGWRQDFWSFFVGCNRRSLQDAGFKVILLIYLLIYLSTLHISVYYLCAILFVHQWVNFLPPIMLDSYKICCRLTTTQLLCAHSVSHSKVKASNIQESEFYLDPWSFCHVYWNKPIVGVLLLVKQRIDVLNGIAWDNMTARLFGEWILSGYFHDIWVFTLTWQWLGINLTDSACNGRETMNDIAFIWSHISRNFQQLLWIVTLYFWELHGMFPTLALAGLNLSSLWWGTCWCTNGKL